MSTAPLTEETVRRLVDDWYDKLDVHAPADEVLPLVVEDDPEFVLPEGAERGTDAVRAMLNRFYTSFFDEVHTLKECRIAINGDRATVNLVVNWQCRVRKPPAPKSDWLGFDAFQTWEVERTGTGPRIRRYRVDELRPMPGSAGL
jgi:hypothetical protein